MDAPLGIPVAYYSSAGAAPQVAITVWVGGGLVNLVVSDQSGTVSGVTGVPWVLPGEQLPATGPFAGVLGTLPASGFMVSCPAAWTAGAAQPITVTALDPYNNVAVGFTSTVSFAASDSAATLPRPATMTGGVGTFSATLATAGTQTLTATDLAWTSSVSGSSPALTVT